MEETKWMKIKKLIRNTMQHRTSLNVDIRVQIKNRWRIYYFINNTKERETIVFNACNNVKRIW